jgi:lactose/L-arabinose transport system ATP-binding protein
MTLADKIVVLNAGKIEQIGRPLELYGDPDSQFVAGFVGSPKMNFMQAEVVGAEPGRVTVELVNQGRARLTLPLGRAVLAVGAALTVGVRPEHFGRAGEGEVDLEVRMDVTEHLGATSYVYANMGAEELVIEREAREVAGAAEALTVSIAAGQAYLFDAAGARLR